MKPYEIKQTIKIIQKLTGEETVKIGIDLTETSLKILIDSIFFPNCFTEGLKTKKI